MMNFEIIPKVGIGPIKLGMSRIEVEGIFGQPEHESNERIGYYSGFMIDFDENHKVEFIELAKSNNFSATLNGVNLHEVSAIDAVNYVSKIDNFDKTEPEQGYSYIFKGIQLSLWRGTMPENEADDDGKYFEAVGIAVENYFE